MGIDSHKKPRKLVGEGEGVQEALTRQFIRIFLTANLVSSRRFPDGLVACGEKGDGDKGNKKREDVSDPPPVEDYAQVRGVPGEEHVHVARGLVHVHSAVVHARHTVVHMAVICSRKKDRHTRETNWSQVGYSSFVDGCC